MEKINNLVKEIMKNDKSWENYKEIKEINEPKTLELLNDLISEVRKMVKNDEEESLEMLSQYVENDQLCKDIIAFSRFTLMHYKNFAIVRQLEESNRELAAVLFQNIMDKFVLRLDFDFQETYEIYNAKSEEEFYDFLESYDTLVSYYVQRHYSRKAIVKDIIEETEISDEDAEVFADLIGRNYRDLQLNLIIDSLQKNKN
ncbi:MAG: hypothetical protein J6K58_14735 [Lachnospiraceae bacterium]|nr:hypothetical protein [Lachnospiraceae bacterium]